MNNPLSRSPFSDTAIDTPEGHTDGFGLPELPGVPSQCIHLIQDTLSANGFDCLRTPADHIIAKGDMGIELYFRGARSENTDWVVMAMPVIGLDSDEAIQGVLYFLALSHQLAHQVETPFIYGLNPHTEKIEMMVSLRLEDISQSELLNFVDGFRQGIQQVKSLGEMGVPA